MKRIKLARIDCKRVSREIGAFVIDQIRSTRTSGSVVGLFGGVDSSTTAALIKGAFDRHTAVTYELVGYILPSGLNKQEALADPGNTNARVDLMFRERAFALFATGHRVGDMRRLVRQYGRAGYTVVPIGPYYKDNLTRGGDQSFVVPANEENNPQFKSEACNKLAS